MMPECLNLFLAVITNNPLMPSRLGKAAVGRIYNSLVHTLFVKPLSPEEMCSILGAVYCYMQNPDSVPEGCVRARGVCVCPRGVCVPAGCVRVVCVCVGVVCFLWFFFSIIQVLQCAFHTFPRI